MRVFYAVQMSNFTVVDGRPKWMMRSDACVNICVGIISTILDRHPDITFLVKLPPSADTHDVKHLEELFQPKYRKAIEIYRESIPVSPFTSRFNFDFGFHEKNAKVFANVDVMINDENTLTKNWKVLFRHLGLKIPIVTTNYFFDSPISPKNDIQTRYCERQIESMFCSDMFTFQVDVAMRDAIKAVEMIYKDTSQLAPRSVWSSGAYYGEVSRFHSEKSKKPIFYFGNRITDSVNRYTMWHKYAEAIGKLSKRVDPSTWDAWILNPTRKISDSQMEEIMSLSNGTMKVIPNDAAFPREEYLEFINNANISCNLFVGEVHGGTTHVEAMMARNIMICPKINAYEFKYLESGKIDEYPFIFDLKECEPTVPGGLSLEIDTDVLADKMELATKSVQEGTNLSYGELNRTIAYEFESYEMRADKVVDNLRSLLPVEA